MAGEPQSNREQQLTGLKIAGTQLVKLYKDEEWVKNLTKRGSFSNMPKENLSTEVTADSKVTSSRQQTKAEPAAKTSMQKTPTTSKQRTPSAIQSKDDHQIRPIYKADLIKGKGELGLGHWLGKSSMNLSKYTQLYAKQENNIAIIGAKAEFRYLVIERTWDATLSKDISRHLGANIGTNNNHEVKTSLSLTFDF